MNIKKMAFIALWLSSTAQAVSVDFAVVAPGDDLLIHPEFAKDPYIYITKQTEVTPKLFDFLKNSSRGYAGIYFHDIRTHQMDELGYSEASWSAWSGTLDINCLKPSKSSEQLFEITLDNGGLIDSYVCNDEHSKTGKRTFDISQYEHVTITVSADKI